MKIYLTGSTGLLGKSIMREINSKHEVITYSSDQINLLEYQEVYESLKRSRPDMIIHCASLVGGIIFNVNNPYTMAWKNSIINMNILRASENLEIEKLISIGELTAVTQLMHQNPSEKLTTSRAILRRVIQIMP